MLYIEGSCRQYTEKYISLLVSLRDEDIIQEAN